MAFRRRASPADGIIIVIALVLLLDIIAPVSADRYVCPPAGGAPLALPLLAGGSDPTDPLILNATARAGELCTLTLRDAAGIRPIARSYNGKDWEVTAGPLSETLDSPTCSDAADAPAIRHCFFSSLPPAAAVTNGSVYTLTTYADPGYGDAAEAARFLEQATFGPTQSDIDSLTSPGNGGTLNFTAWVRSQISVPVTSLRESYRRSTNARYEYAAYPAGAGPASACETTSHWRTFALTRRDGIRSSQTKESKYLSVEFRNDRYVWMVEGMARTTTATVPTLLTSEGDFIENFQLYPAAIYQIHFNDNDRKDCVGCPVKVVRFPGHQVGYVDNPTVDLTGIEGDASLVPYTVVDLPPILSDGGANSDGMVAVDDPTPEIASSPYYSKYHKAGDEFWLNTTDTIDAAQCAGHPNTVSAAFDTPTQLDASGTDEVWNAGECPDGSRCTVHVATAAPSIFGRSLNAQTGQYEHLLFDPHVRLLENTVDNPSPDGGGLIHYESNSKVWCSNAPRSFLNEDGCRLSYSPFACEESNGGDPRSGVPNPNSEPIVVCGSVGEVANDLQLGATNGYDLLNSDVSKTFNRNTYLDGEFKEYKNIVWANHALGAPDQLRARVAWALYQIIPIGTTNTDNTNTETWLQYYDIFVRHAFGSFKDILKEISYTDVMSVWLTFSENKSLQYNLDDGKGSIHPDENFAREIMQLFSIGIFQLNRDGTKKLDAEGNPLETYDSSDIMNFARAWTGFDREYRYRGNAESGKWGPHVDLMFINREYRDIYPKSDLLGGYIGDGYPLCADLPDKDHLRKGATYRLQGRNSNPSLQLDWFRWASTNPVPRLEITPASPLYSKLCALEGGVCTFPGKVVLDENLIFDAVAQTGSEYNVDTIRTLRIDYEGNAIYYEYMRPPCVDQAFLGTGAKKTIRGNVDTSGDQAYAVESSVCADPRRYIATEMCCNPGWEDSWDVNDHGFRYCNYHAERVRYDAAVSRCEEQGKVQCNPLRLAGGACAYDVSRKVWSSWSSAGCSTRAKLSYKDVGLVGRVDQPSPDWNGDRVTAHIVDDTTANFFKVAWSDPSYTSSLPVDATACSAFSSCYSVGDGCICDTTLAESPVFTSASQIGSKDDVISSLFVGAFEPDTFDGGEIVSLGNCGIDGLAVYSTYGSDTCASLTVDAFFGVIDGQGVQKYLKNLQSVVTIDSIGVSYRNPVHFISFVDQDLRDMHYETDAVIEHFFHHPSHAPFLSLRFLQRFGLSNPSPGLVERVATAYIEGSYNGIGSGAYGDLSALVAAILLDDESRSTTLDADPANGSLREPIVKVISLLRSMDAVYTAPSGDEKLYKLGIGQDSFGSPSVFSFFLPEYQPSGGIEISKLVAPEAQVMNGNKVTTYLDGMFSSVKFGLTSCFQGFGQNHASSCSILIDGMTDTGDGYLSWSADPSASIDEVIDSLSILLTAGRLGSTNKAIIRSTIENEFTNGDRAKAVRVGQQLILASPENQVWGAVSRNTGVPRQITGYTLPPASAYKNVVYFYLPGGLDSWNLVVPKAGCVGKDMFAEYEAARQSLAMPKDDFLDIDATGQGHSCSTWGINKYFPVLKSLYDAGEALFFLNTGVLSKPLTKHDDWITESAIQLFAHNHMSREQLRVDPLDLNPGTGVGGRMLDVLKNIGFQTSGNTVDGSSLLNVGDTYYSNPTFTVATGDPSLLDEVSSLAPGEMLELTKQLNGNSADDNSLLGETWSERFSKSLFEYSTALEIDAAVKSGDFNMNDYPVREGPGAEFRAAAQFMKSRGMRKVDREVFSVKHDTSYDTHGDTSTAGLPGKLGQANQALSEFIAELVRQGIWEDTAILLGSDFGRSLEPNSNGGSDHGWGGHTVMVGGGVKGGQILGEYPADLSESSDQWIRRGRMIPTTPFDSVWNGVSQWMGVESEADLDFVLPNRQNFDASTFFTKQDLFEGPPAPTPPPTTLPGFFEAEDATSFGSGTQAKPYSGANTGTGIVDMGGTGSWFEFSGNDLILEKGGACTIDVRYTLGGTNVDRDCEVTLNGDVVGTLDFPDTGGWDNWQHEVLTATCLEGPNTLRITAVGANGGPNIDSIYIQTEAVSPTQAPNSAASSPPSVNISSAPSAEPSVTKSSQPSITASHAPSDVASLSPSLSGSETPSYAPTTSKPTGVPSNSPTSPPSSSPSSSPTTSAPNPSPSNSPTSSPSSSPSSSPTTSAPNPSPSSSQLVPVGSVILGSANTQLGIPGCIDASDGTTNKCTIVRSDFLSNDEVGFVATSSQRSIVKKIRVYTANNYKSRDPASYSIEGRNDESETWQLISSGPISLTRRRNGQGVAIVSTYESPDTSRKYEEIVFENEAEYVQYRVRFPTTKNNGESSVAFSEVELPGFIYTPGCAAPGAFCSASSECCSGLCEGSFTCANAVSPSQAPSSAASSPPSMSISNAPSVEHSAGPSVTKSTQPTSAPNPSPSSGPGPSQLVPVGSVILGSANTQLGIPGCIDASDGTTNKCTIVRSDFLSNDEVGFVATSSQRSIVKKIRVYTANNYKSRDPASYSIEGRNDESETWQLISSGPISLTRRRNGQGVAIVSTYESPDTSRKYEEIVFENEAEYVQYRVRFPTTKNNGESSVAFSEVELPGFIYTPGCAAPGAFCSASSECCSGLCEGGFTCA